VKVEQWDATVDVKAQIEHAEAKFNTHVKQHIGYSNPLIMPGNYARMMFAEEHQTVILKLVSIYMAIIGIEMKTCENRTDFADFDGIKYAYKWFYPRAVHFATQNLISLKVYYFY